MPLKVAKNDKMFIFSVFREISPTTQMKYALVPLNYESIAINLWKYAKKFDDFEDFLVLVLVDHFSDLPIFNTHLFDAKSIL